MDQWEEVDHLENQEKGLEMACLKNCYSWDDLWHLDAEKWENFLTKPSWYKPEREDNSEYNN